VTRLSSGSSSPLVSPGVGLRSHLLTVSRWMRRVADSLSREGYGDAPPWPLLLLLLLPPPLLLLLPPLPLLLLSWSPGRT
jgi:hypothetical protein